MLLNSWKSAFIPCGCNVRGRSMPGSAGASTVSQKLLHRSPRIGKSRAGRIVLADTGRDPDAFSVAGGVGVSRRHIARGAAQDRLDFARRELRIDLKQQRTQGAEVPLNTPQPSAASVPSKAAPSRSISQPGGMGSAR